VDAPAEGVAGEGGVVLFRVVAEERQAQAAPALEGAVAGARVAAGAAEEADDVPLEIDLLDGAAVGQWHDGAGVSSGEDEEGERGGGGPEAGDAGSMHSAILRKVCVSPKQAGGRSRRRVRGRAVGGWEAAWPASAAFVQVGLKLSHR